MKFHLVLLVASTLMLAACGNDEPATGNQMTAEEQADLDEFSKTVRQITEDYPQQ